MNCNLVIANDYEDLLKDIKELSKSRLLLERGPAYQFDLSLLKMAYFYPRLKVKITDVNVIYLTQKIRSRICCKP